MKKKLILLSILTGILIIVGFGAWFFSRPQAATTCQDVMIYQDTNYSTSAPNACFAPGQYTLAGLRSKGIADDSVSSIKMPSGFKVTVYKNDNFSGESISFTGSVPNLQDVRMNVFHTWNEKISSLKIVYTICPLPLSETRTGSCPSGQTGLITEIRTKLSAPGCTWGDWEEISNTCKTLPPPPPPPTPAPTVNLKVNGSNGPITVDYNSTVKLSWSSTNADSCTASGGWSDSRTDHGEEETGNLTQETTFTLTCTRNGSSSDSVIVKVNAAPDQEPTPEPTPEPIPTPTPTPIDNQPLSDDSQTPDQTNQTPTNDANVDTTVTPDSIGSDLTDQTIDQSSGTTQETQPAQKTSIWIYIVIIAVVISGVVYFLIRIRKTQLTGEDLLKQGSEPAPETEEAPIAPPPPPAPTSSPSSPLPPNIPSTTMPAEKTDDMDID